MLTSITTCLSATYFLRNPKRRKLLTNWHVTTYSPMSGGYVTPSLECWSCTQDYRKVGAISASQVFLQNPMMINCLHLGTSKDFWSGWTFFEFTAIKWTGSTQCCTQQNTNLASDGELLLYMFLGTELLQRFKPFEIDSTIIRVYENYLIIMGFASEDINF